jgi:hypothetical protein
MDATRTCSEIECSKPVHARGRCRSHYRAWAKATPKHLRPTGAPRGRRRGGDPALRFHAKYIRKGAGDCWEWQGARKPSGHGNFALTQQNFVTASHYALILATGGRPEGAYACHRCDNPPCVNPAHLYWGTAQDNMNNQLARGRRPRGTEHARALLTEEQVIEIRERYAAGETTKAIEIDFGLKYNVAGPIVHGKTWAHVGGPITFKRASRLATKGKEANRG